MDDNDQPIQDAEIIEPQNTSSNGQSKGDATEVLLSLEQLIKTNISSIDKLKEELRVQKQMLADVFASSEIYKKHEKQTKEAAKLKVQTKLQILKQPAVVLINNKIKSMSQDIKERGASLSDYLKEYQRMTGANQIESEDGELLEIVQTAKVVRKSAKFT